MHLSHSCPSKLPRALQLTAALESVNQACAWRSWYGPARPIMSMSTPSSPRLTLKQAKVVTLALSLCALSAGTPLLAAACTPKTPPTPDVDAAVAPLPGPAANSSSGSGGPSTPSGSNATAAAASASSSTNSASAANDAKPAALVDAGDPGALPQTKDKPPASSEALTARAAALWDGITHDDPDRAMPFFFPVTAYEQVKAIPSPAGDWRRRLVAAYKRDIHGLNKRLVDTKAVDSAKFVRLDVPDERARWVEPNEESNKLGYYRVYGTRIIYEVDGKEKSLEISSLISWRGEWYVVHLTGFK